MTLEQESIKQLIQGATEKHKKYIVENLPTNLLEKELERRNIETVNVMQEIYNVLSTLSEDMTYDEMRSFIKELKKVVSLKPKRKIIIENPKEEINEQSETNVPTE